MTSGDGNAQISIGFTFCKEATYAFPAHVQRKSARYILLQAWQAGSGCGWTSGTLHVNPPVQTAAF